MDRLGSLVVVLGASAVAGCGPSDPGVDVVSESRGDTTIVTTPGAVDVPLLTIDSLEIAWRSDSIAFGVEIARVGDRLILADPDRLHYLTADGEYIQSVGRRGEGPGEFGLIQGLDSRHDTLFVLDVRLNRMSFYDASGTLMGSERQLPNPRFAGMDRPKARIRLYADGYGHAAVPGLVQVNVAMDAAIVWHQFASDSSRIAGPWFWWELVEAGGLIADPHPLGPRATMAVGRDGHWAQGDGVTYCFDIANWDDPAVTRACREWARPPVTRAVSSPDFDEMVAVTGMSPERRMQFEDVIAHQDLGAAFPSFDLLWFAENGDVWVRTFDPERAVQLPYFEQFQELRPPFYSWDVFAPDGRLRHTVRLPSNFEPKLILEDEVWGFATMPVGDRALARAAW